MTLIEVMVVVAIIAVLMGLILPAIHAARRASSRSFCANNLNQIGQAMHNYDSVWSTLPIGAMGRHGRGYPLSGDPTGASSRRSWSFPVLPFLDSSALYNSYNFCLGFDAAANSSAVRARVSVYLCPADPGSSTPIDLGRPTQRVRGNYAVNWGNTHFDQARGPDPFVGPLGSAKFLGAPFGYDACYPLSGIVDGMANTLLMSELLNPAPFTSPSNRRGDIHGDDPNAAMFMAYAPPNATTPDQMPRVVGSPGCVASGPSTPCNLLSPAFNTARSLHPGGVNVLMADGTVRFIKDSIHLETWRMVSTSRGGETDVPKSY
jgi:prepilin-type processing-associated H-X9-DG protein